MVNLFCSVSPYKNWFIPALIQQHNVNVHKKHVTPTEASDPVKRWKMAADKNISIYNDQFSSKWFFMKPYSDVEMIVSL